VRARQLIENTDIKDELFDLPDEWWVQRKKRLPTGEMVTEYLKVCPLKSFLWVEKPRFCSVFYLEQAQLMAERVYRWHGEKEASDDLSIHVVRAEW